MSGKYVRRAIMVTMLVSAVWCSAAWAAADTEQRGTRVTQTTVPWAGQPPQWPAAWRDTTAPKAMEEGGPVMLRAGWPVCIPGAENGAAAFTSALFDMDGDGAQEIFVNSDGHTFGLKGDGSFLPGWPTQQLGAHSYGTNGNKPGPSAADLDNDGEPEVVWPLRDWWYGSVKTWSFNGKYGDFTNLPNFPQAAPDSSSNAFDTPFVLGDADGDGRLEMWTGHSLGNAFIDYRLSAFDHLGNRMFTRDLSDPNDDIVGLCFGDLDGDGDKEMVGFSTLSSAVYMHVFQPDGSHVSGYPIQLYAGAGYLAGVPFLADLDADGDLEAIFGVSSSHTYIHCRHHDGSTPPGWPILVGLQNQLFDYSIGDITGDGVEELLVTVNYRPTPGLYRVFAMDMATATPLAGWPYDVWSWPKGVPAVADVDDDGLQDVLVTTDGGELHAISGDGKAIPGFPKIMNAASLSGVSVGDIDGDGLFELVASTWTGCTYAWDTPAPAWPARTDWPMRGVNARNTGVYRDYDRLVGDLNCDGEIDFGDINPFVLALTNPAGYAQQFPNCDRFNADINMDGNVDFGDINPFVRLLTQP